MLTMMRYVWLTAVRDRMLLGLVVLMLACYGMCVFLAGTAVLEKGAFLVTLLAGSLRLLLALGVLVFVVFHVRRSFEQKEVEVALSRPLGRATYLLGYALGLWRVVLVLWLVAALLVAFTLGAEWSGWALWAASLLTELWLLSTLALVVALMMRSAVLAVMGSLVIYSMGRLGILLVSTAESSFSKLNHTFDTFAPVLLQAAAMLTPRLDMLAQTRWLVYGLPSQEQLGWMLLQPLIYIPLLLVLGMVDFSRRQF